MISAMAATSATAMASAVGARANSAGVTLFTLMSVVCSAAAAGSGKPAKRAHSLLHGYPMPLHRRHDASLAQQRQPLPTRLPLPPQAHAHADTAGPFPRHQKGERQDSHRDHTCADSMTAQSSWNEPEATSGTSGLG